MCLVICSTLHGILNIKEAKEIIIILHKFNIPKNIVCIMFLTRRAEKHSGLAPNQLYWKLSKLHDKIDLYSRNTFSVFSC